MTLRDELHDAQDTISALPGNVNPIEEVRSGALPHGAEPIARSQWQLFIRRFWRHKLAVVSLLILVGLYLMAIFAKQLAPYPLNPKLDASTLLQARHGPSMKHFFGTDELGRDQLTRIMFAA